MIAAGPAIEAKASGASAAVAASAMIWEPVSTATGSNTKAKIRLRA